MTRSSLAVSSDAAAEEAAQATLADGGGSIDAVVAGFLGAAGARPDVLLCPTVVLLAGVGMGARCLDGRPLQPGRSNPRPRGFVDPAAIPPAARVAAPRSVAAIALLHAYGARKDMTALARRGAALAKAQGAQRRAELVAAVGRQGAQALRGGAALRGLLWASGRGAGGLLSEADLEQALPGDGSASTQPISAEATLALPPWSSNPEPAEPQPEASRAQATEVIVAVEAQGPVVVLSFSPDPGGVPVPELELSLPRDAAPVRRGVARITPGTVLPAAAPVGILSRPAEGFFAALGLAGAAALSLEPRVDDESLSLKAQLESLKRRNRARAALAATVRRRAVALVRA